MSIDGLVQAIATLTSAGIAVMGALIGGVIGAIATTIAARRQLEQTIQAERVSRSEFREEVLLTSITAFYSELMQVAVMLASGSTRVRKMWVPLETAAYLDARQHMVLLPKELQSLIRACYTYIHQYNHLVAVQNRIDPVDEELSADLEDLSETILSAATEVGEALRQHMNTRLGTKISEPE